MILVIGARHFETDGPVEHRFERADVPVGGPQLQLRVPSGPQAREIIVIARIEVDPRERLRMAPVEAFSEPYHGGQRADRAAERSRKLAVPEV